MCTKPDPTKEAAQLALRHVNISGRWRHYKGGLYDVICLAVDHATLRPVVVHRSVNHGWVWTRPVEEWLGKVEVNGTEVPRYEFDEAATKASLYPCCEFCLNPIYTHDTCYGDAGASI